MSNQHCIHIGKKVKRAVSKLNPDAMPAKRLVDFPLAKAFGWSYARGIPTDEQLKVYKQKK